MQLHFIVNDYAGGGQGKKKWALIERELTLDYNLHKTNYKGHATELARFITEQRKRACIIAVGGDGTVHEVLNGIQSAEHIVLGAVRAGSGNDFTRGFSSFVNAQQIEQFVTKQHSVLQDYGVIHFDNRNLIFVNNCGIGFDALVTRRANNSRLKKVLNKFGLGKLSYSYFVVQALLTFKPFQLSVIHNGEVQYFQDVWFATVNNQPYYGGGMKLAPNSKMNDGILELTVVNKLSRWKLMFLFGTVFFAKHTNFKEVKQVASESFTLHFDERIYCHTDGEIQTLQPGKQTIHIDICKQAWQLAKK